LNVQEDHVHVVVSIPPKVSVSDYMVIIKGMSAMRLFKTAPRCRKSPSREISKVAGDYLETAGDALPRGMPEIFQIHQESWRADKTRIGDFLSEQTVLSPVKNL
jgi:REP element-mobilizing transposase RayT